MTEDFYDTEWNLMNISRPSHGHGDLQKKPSQLEKMLMLATKLSDQAAFTRVDFYMVNGKVYFGEITLYPASGWNQFEPSKWDYKFGEWLSV